MNLSSIDGWFQFPDLYERMVNQYDNTIFCEIGTFKGASAVFLGQKIKQNNKNIKVVCVDLWPSPSEIEKFSHLGAGQGEESVKINRQGESLMQEFVNHVNDCNLQDTLFPLRTHSVYAASLFPDNYFSFVFIDAGHSKEQVINDINAWLPKVKSGGVLAGHDYYGHTKDGVDEVLGQQNILEEKVHCWVFNKNNKEV